MPHVIPWPDPPILAAIITSLGIAFGAWLTWLASGARELRERIGALEARIATVEAVADRVRSERDELSQLVLAMVSFINRVGAWVETTAPRGRRPRPPEKVAPHIDTEPWMPHPEDVQG